MSVSITIVLSAAASPAADLLGDVSGWALLAERCDVEEVGDLRPTLEVVAEVTVAVGPGGAADAPGSRGCRRGGRCAAARSGGRRSGSYAARRRESRARADDGHRHRTRKHKADPSSRRRSSATRADQPRLDVGDRLSVVRLAPPGAGFVAEPGAFGRSQLIGDALLCDEGSEVVVHLSSWTAGRSRRGNDRRADVRSHQRSRRPSPL